MSGTLRLVAHQLRYEQLVFWRTPAAVFFTFALAPVMLVIFAGLNGSDRVDEFGDVTFAQYFVPGMIAFGLMSTTYGNLVGRFVVRRETGLLKRTRATPLPTPALLGGFITSAVVVTAAGTLLILAIGVIGYNVTFPADRWLPLVVVVAVGAAAFCALGLALVPFVPTVEATDPIIFGTLLPLLFISGAFDPVDPTSSIGRIAAIFPVRHLVDAALAVFDLQPGGGTIAWDHLAIVAAWGIAGAAIATRWFRWDPHHN